MPFIFSKANPSPANKLRSKTASSSSVAFLSVAMRQSTKSSSPEKTPAQYGYCLRLLQVTYAPSLLFFSGYFEYFDLPRLDSFTKKAIS